MKRLFNNTVFSGIDLGVLVILNLLATPILIKYLGLAEYGVFVFLSVFSTYGMLSFFDFGMEGSLLNYVARFEAAGDRERIQDTLTIALIYYGVIGLILGVVLALASGLITGRFADDAVLINQDAVLRATYIVAVNVVVQFLTLPLTAVLQGLRRFVITKATNSVLMTLQYVTLMVSAAIYQRVDVAMVVVLCITVCRLGVLSFVVWFRTDYFRPMRFRVSWDLFKTFFSYSSILLVSRVIGMVFNQMDKFLIWLYLAATHMTVYDIAVRPATLLRMLITTVNSAIIPEVARLHEKNDIAPIRALYINLVRYAYLLVMPLLAVLYGHMESILTLWVWVGLGKYYPLALVVVSVHLMSPITAVASTMAVGLQLVKKVLWISIIASVIKIVLSALLLSWKGLIGLLIATLIAEIFMVGPYLTAMMRILEMKAGELFRPILKIVAAAVPFGLIHFGVNYLYGHTTVIWLPAAAGLALIHLAVSYRYLLRERERAYLMERLRSGWSRLIPSSESQ
jgi:O-antigen/teichoic acid export membrane protein